MERGLLRAGGFTTRLWRRELKMELTSADEAVGAVVAFNPLEKTKDSIQI